MYIILSTFQQPYKVGVYYYPYIADWGGGGGTLKQRKSGLPKATS